jgi:hypothetical protein
MRDAHRGIIDQADREFLYATYTALAKFYQEHRLWRNYWSVEVDGCVYKFKLEGYAKKGSEIWKEQQAEIAALEPKP